MPSFNQVTLMGNLTRDVELRFTPKGTAVAKLTLAVNRKWRTDGGEQKEECAFVDLTAFGKSAETLGQYVKKGDPLFAVGRLNLETWDDKQTGQKRSKLAVVLETFQLLSGRRDGATTAASPRTPPPCSPAASSDDAPKDGEDVPF
jgi:single-strand DNA-binding protein